MTNACMRGKGYFEWKESATVLHVGIFYWCGPFAKQYVTTRWQSDTKEMKFQFYIRTGLYEGNQWQLWIIRNITGKKLTMIVGQRFTLPPGLERSLGR